MGKSKELATLKDGGTIDGALTVDGGYTDFETQDTNNYARVTTVNGSAQLGLYRSGAAAGGFYIGGDSSKFRVYDSGFTPRMEVDASGRVTMPYQPMMAATSQSAGHTTYSNTNYIPSSVDLNVGGHYNVATGVFTCPVAGYYEAAFYTLVNTPSSSSYASFQWRKNGSAIAPNYHTSYNYSRSYEPISGSYVIQASANDTISLNANTLNSAQVYSGYYNCMTIRLIG